MLPQNLVYRRLITWGFWTSCIMLVLTLVLVPLVIARLPQDYFAHQRRHPVPDSESFGHRAGRIAKNIGGAVLVLVGLVLLFGPGHGTLTILTGFMLANFPGKYRLERWMAARPPIWRSLAWIRRRAGCPPLDVPLPHRPLPPPT